MLSLQPIQDLLRVMMLLLRGRSVSPSSHRSMTSVNSSSFGRFTGADPPVAEAAAPRTRSSCRHRHARSWKGTRDRPLAHALLESRRGEPPAFSSTVKIPPPSPAARKGYRGRLLRRLQPDHPAAPLADFFTAVPSLEREFTLSTSGRLVLQHFCPSLCKGKFRNARGLSLVLSPICSCLVPSAASG